MLLLLACTGEPVLDSTFDYEGEPGLFELSFDHDGETRQALVVVPESYVPGGALLLNFHGFGGTSEDHLAWADFRDLADQHGFIVAYPQGTELDGSPHWNAAHPGADNKSTADDVGFAEKLVDTIEFSYGTGPVYAVGYSNGGMFSYFLACETDLLSGVGAVSGTMLDSSPCDTDPTRMVSMHGTRDAVLAYDGGEGAMAQQDIVAFWVDTNGLSGSPTETEDGSITRIAYDGDEPVHHYRIRGGDHVWFDETFEGQGVNAILWAFFSG